MKKTLIALLIALPFLAHAEFLSGNKLLEKMNAGDFHSQGMALGYIVGVHDALAGVSVCAPESVTAGQLEKIIKMWFDNNPTLLHYSADRAIFVALKAIWPCAKKPAGVSM